MTKFTARLLWCCLFPVMGISHQIFAENVNTKSAKLRLRQSVQEVSGRVTSETGEELPGVNVLVKGTANGTTTGADGKYAIAVADANAVLVFSSVGFEKQEINVGASSTIDVVLKVDSKTLDDVVVVGYGTQKKVTLTGSIATVEPKTLQSNAVGNLTQALQGSVPGVTVTTANTPGGDATIRIRGLGTINNNNPLWVVDGVPRYGGINEISPNDIQTLTVLKDASATAIYGARGANGVILVTTIQGKKGQAPRISLNVRVGTTKNTRRHDMLSVDEYGEMLWLQSKNSGITPTHPIYGSGATPRVPKYLIPTGAEEADLSKYDINTFPITEANPQGTDWYNEMYRKGMTKEYSLAITGGSENTTYGFSAGMLKEDGIIIKTGYERYTLRSNITTQVNKWLEVGENLGFSYTNDHGNQEASGEDSPFGQLLELTAIMPVRDIRGNWAPTSRMTGIQTNNNPIAELYRKEDFTGKNLGISGNAYAKVNILKNLSVKSLFGLNFSNFHSKSPNEPNPESYVARPYPELSEGYSEGRQWNWTNTVNYNTTLGGKHNIGVLLGTEAINSTSQNISASRNQFFATTEDYWVLDAGEGNIQNSGNASDWSTFSLFGRINYEFANKYLIDATIRRDGSSRFGKNSRYGNFPAFSAGWILSEEAFLKSSATWLDFLKVRASWGKSGNDQIGNYNGFTTFKTSPITSYYPITGSNTALATGFESGTFGNPNARWETTTTTNFGVDATFFKKLDITVDIWQRNTNDMLYPLSVPYVYGIATNPSVNIGDMQNRGIDLQIGTHGTALGQDLRYNVTANISHYRNKIVRLSGNDLEAIQGGAIREQVYTRAEKGTSFPQFYGYQVDGIFNTQEEATNYPVAFGSAYNAPGHFKFRDVNGDNVIDTRDRTYVGNPHPDFTAGLNGNVQYKQFDFTAVFYASVGNDILNLNRRSLDFNLFQRNRGKRRLYESWGSPYLKDNADAKMPIAEINDAVSQQPSSYYVEDGSFLRLQSLQLGYNLPDGIAKKIFAKKLRVYAMATNLFTLTKYTGLDPQIQTGDNGYGVDIAVWPTPKRFLVGINIEL